VLGSKAPMPTLGYRGMLHFAPAKMRILNPTGGPEAHDCSREYAAPAKMPLEHGSGGLGEGLEVDVVAEGLQALRRVAADVGPDPGVEVVAAQVLVGGAAGEDMVGDDQDRVVLGTGTVQRA
jgi:hypothetical protein